MLKHLAVCFAVVVQFCSLHLTAQPIKAPMFGKDIVISDSSEQNQIAYAICSAPNGWLYAAYTHDNPQGYSAVHIFRSMDNGESWVQLGQYPLISEFLKIPKIEIVVHGTDSINYKLFLSWVYYDSYMNLYRPAVSRFNAITGEVEGPILIESFYSHSDIGISTDWPNPAIGGNPFTIAVVYTIDGTYGSDSLVIETSSNGGMSFDHRSVIDFNPMYSDYQMGDVSVSYGSCPSYNTGRYFVVWEKLHKTDPSKKKIYTAHSEPNYNSSFTNPIRIDTIDVLSNNKCINPVIACQNNGINNSNGNLTEVILFQKFVPNENRFEIAGCYNVQAANTNSFNTITTNELLGNEIQPDIAFNSFTSEFVATYFDSTSKSLPVIKQDINISSPNSWSLMTSGYNDNDSLTEPNPKIAISNSKQSAAFLWGSQRENNNKTALFDGQFSTYTGINTQNSSQENIPIFIYPNPASTSATFKISNSSPGQYKLTISDLTGRTVFSDNPRLLLTGENHYILNISSFQNGIYIANWISEDGQGSCKLVVMNN